MVDYDPRWPALYTREAQRIRSLLFIQEYAQAKDPIIDDIYAKAFAEYDGG